MVAFDVVGGPLLNLLLRQGNKVPGALSLSLELIALELGGVLVLVSSGLMGVVCDVVVHCRAGLGPARLREVMDDVAASILLQLMVMLLYKVFQVRMLGSSVAELISLKGLIPIDILFILYLVLVTQALFPLLHVRGLVHVHCLRWILD